MKSLNDNQTEVLEATPEDERRAIDKAVDYSGCKTILELQEQARSGSFSSYRARQAWFGVATLVE